MYSKSWRPTEEFFYIKNMDCLEHTSKEVTMHTLKNYCSSGLYVPSQKTFRDYDINQQFTIEVLFYGKAPKELYLDKGQGIKPLETVNDIAKFTTIKRHNDVPPFKIQGNVEEFEISHFRIYS